MGGDKGTIHCKKSRRYRQVYNAKAHHMEEKLVKPYTYLLINETSWYIGVRCANKVPAEQDVQYMSSSKYIKARIKAGEVFVKHILGEYHTREEASAAEDVYLREYWDVPGRVNKALGGKFTYEFDNEIRAKMSTSAKAKNSKAQKFAQKSPEARAKRSATAKAIFSSPEVRAKRSAIMKAVYSSPEVRAKISATVKAALSSPEARAKIGAKISKPCTLDGITVYPSRKALADELGLGKKGVRNPSFRYV